MRGSNDPEIGIEIMEDYDIKKALYDLNWHLSLRISERDENWHHIKHAPDELRWLMEVRDEVKRAIQVSPRRIDVTNNIGG